MPTVRNVADHAVDDPNGAVLLPGQTADWDDADYVEAMTEADLVLAVDDEDTSSVPVAEPDDPGAGKTGDPTSGSSSSSSGGSTKGSAGSSTSTGGSSGSSGGTGSSGSSGSAGASSTTSSTTSGGSQ